MKSLQVQQTKLLIFQNSTEHSTLYFVLVRYAILILHACISACKLHQSFDAFKRGKKSDCWSVTVEKKDPKANPYLPTKETIIPEQDCQIPFVSLYPCGRPRKETAVLLCNWGLSITGFMHDFRWVTHNFPWRVLLFWGLALPCFCRMHLLWSV